MVVGGHEVGQHGPNGEGVVQRVVQQEAHQGLRPVRDSRQPERGLAVRDAALGVLFPELRGVLFQWALLAQKMRKGGVCLSQEALIYAALVADVDGSQGVVLPTHRRPGLLQPPMVYRKRKLENEMHPLLTE